MNALEVILVKLPSELNRIITEYTAYVTDEVAFSIGVKKLSTTLSFKVYSSDKVSDLQQKIFAKWKIPISEQSLQIGGKLMAPERELRDYSLKPGDMVYLTRGVRG